MYNSAGKMQRVNDYNASGALNGYCKYTRNSKGQPVNSYFYNGSNTQTGRSFCYF